MLTVPCFMNSFPPKIFLSAYLLKWGSRSSKAWCEKSQWPSTCHLRFRMSLVTKLRKPSLLSRLSAHLLVEVSDISHVSPFPAEVRSHSGGRLQLAECQPAGGDAWKQSQRTDSLPWHRIPTAPAKRSEGPGPENIAIGSMEKFRAKNLGLLTGHVTEQPRLRSRPAPFMSQWVAEGRRLGADSGLTLVHSVCSAAQSCPSASAVPNDAGSHTRVLRAGRVPCRAHSRPASAAQPRGSATPRPPNTFPPFCCKSAAWDGVKTAPLPLFSS